MNFFLKVAAAYQAVRFTMELCREAKQLKAKPVAVEPIVVATPAQPDSGSLPTVMQENTPDLNQVGVSDSAGSIPGYDDQGSIAEVAEGDSLRKSTGRIGVDEDCSAGSPTVEQQHSKKKPRPPSKRSRIRQTIPRFTIVEPTLVNLEFR
jgi:hypothetical protein